MNKAWLALYFVFVMLGFAVLAIPQGPLLPGLTPISPYASPFLGWTIVGVLTGSFFLLIILRVIYVGLRNLFR